MESPLDNGGWGSNATPTDCTGYARISNPLLAVRFGFAGKTTERIFLHPVSVKLVMRPTLLVALVAAVVFAGCSGVTGPETESPTAENVTVNERSESPSDSATPSATASATPSATASPTTNGGQASLPPGVTQSGVADASALVEAHTAALERTGFIVTSRGQATIVRQGTLVEAKTQERAAVEANRTAYRATRRDEASFYSREEEAWYDADAGSQAQSRHVKTPGETERRTRDPHPIGALTGKAVLENHLRGGDFTVSNTETVNGGTRVTLVANSVENETAVLTALPDAAQEVTAYEGRAVVDEQGRVHSFTATVEYVIRGERRTYEVDYQIQQIGDVTVQRPPWVNDSS